MAVRKLFCIACGYTCALIISHYLLPISLLLPAAGACLLLAVTAFFLRRRMPQAVTLVLLAALVGFGWNYSYHKLFVEPAQEHVGEKQTVTVRISAYPDAYDEYVSVRVRAVDDEIPHVSMLVYDYSAGMSELAPGDLVEMPLKLLSAGEYYREESDRYLAEGVRLRGYITGEYRAVGKTNLSWIYFPLRICRSIEQQALHVFPKDTAPLMKALLTGNKAELYDDDALYTALRISGLSHIVAVSGMHVAFLIGCLSLVTGRRRITAFLGIPTIVVFMAMVGFSPSVVRAGVMQILLLIAPLLRRENDPPTSLSAALLLLLLINPYAIGSISLQLSFAAMAGLLLVAPRIYNAIVRDKNGFTRVPAGIRGKVLRGIASSVSASIGAIVFTTPLSALWFGFVPLYSVLSNLLCLWAMSAAFLCGYLVCVLGMIWQPLGVVTGWIVAWLPRYSCEVVRQISALPSAALVTRANLGAWWLVFVYIIFIATYLMKGRERYRPIIPICCCLITLAAISLFQTKKLTGQLELAAVDVGQGLCLSALTENATVMIDCGSTGNPENAGDLAANYLQQAGRGSVDLLILTHFHADHANGVERLMNRMEVKYLAIPTDCEDNSYTDDILACCEAYGTEIIRVTENTEITLDGLDLMLYAPLGSEDANEHCLLIRGDFGNFEFLATGDAGSGVEKLLTGFYELGDMELLVVGHHGSKYSTSDRLLDDITPEYAYISVGAGNSYGHPTAEVLDRLAVRDIEVYRTDLHGTISMTVGKENG